MGARPKANTNCTIVTRRPLRRNAKMCDGLAAQRESFTRHCISAKAHSPLLWVRRYRRALLEVHFFHGAREPHILLFAALTSAHCVRSAVRFVFETQKDVFKSPVVHLILLQQALLIH